MANAIQPPSVITYETIGESAVRVLWRPVEGATAYYLRGGGSDAERKVQGTTTEIRGLLPSRNTEIEIRSERGDELSVWSTVVVRPSVNIPPAPLDVPVLPILDADRQSVQLRLPRPDGTNVNVRFYLWWQVSDEGWWASLEVPANFPTISSRRLGVNVGLLDNAKDFLNGNIVMRSTSDDMEVEPKRNAFRDRTHELRFEPF